MPEKTDAALAGILVELERFLTSPPSDAEMDRAKRYLAGSFAVEQQRNASRAAHLTLDGLGEAIRQLSRGARYRRAG